LYDIVRNLTDYMNFYFLQIFSCGLTGYDLTDYNLCNRLDKTIVFFEFECSSLI